MSQESNDKRRMFEQKMRDQGADGFADGPRPWETWDESGHQANSRVWEGSARRVNGKYKKHSLGYRILSVLAFMALATLLVGIGGVYYTHTQTQQIADAGAQPLPVIKRRAPVIAPADSEVVVAAATETEDLNVLTAPAAGSEPAQEPEEVTEEVVEDIVAIPAAETVIVETPVADEPATETTTDTPPVMNGSIDSVAIETVVTEQSITTTVYTRHPQQDEPEIVSAIETTPPPFAHEIATVEQEVTEFTPTVQTDTLVLAEVDAVDTPETTSPYEEQQDRAPDEQTGEATAVAVTEESIAVVATEPAVETAPEATEDQSDAIVEEPSTEQTEDVTTVVLAEESSAMAVIESPAETAAEIIEEQQSETVEPVFPVEKTGDWVINLASYTWKSTANRKLALFQQQGVDAEVFEVMIKDKPMYRIRVVGFESSRSAKAAIPAVEQKLDLEGAWISKR